MQTEMICYDDLVELLRRIFLAHGTSDHVADVLSANCAGAERDSARSHGIFRMPAYASTLKSGWVDGRAVPDVVDAGPAFIDVDACNGFAQPALLAARPLALDKVRETGACVIGVHGSHHLGALWLDLEPFAEAGFVALSVVNSMAVVAPHGGRAPVYGTNPMAFAAPRADGPPIVFDQAASTMAHGDLKIAARDGHPIPEGTGVDREGHLTRDPVAILNGGALLPFGGHKGGSIALMIEILGAALTGGRFSFEVDWSKHPGAQTPCTGQCVILIDPARMGSLAAFTERIERLVAAVRAAGQERLPGERRYQARAKAMQDGIPIGAAELKQLRELAG